jgi:hypothetical protein
VRVRAAHEHRVQGARQPHVVDVLADARQQTPVLAPPHRLTDHVR